MTTTLPNTGQQDYAYIAFALMGALVELDDACKIADAALTRKGYAPDIIDQARAAVKTRIASWTHP